MKYRVTRKHGLSTLDVECSEVSFDDVHVVQFTAYDATNGTHPILAIPFEDFDTATLVETTEATGE